MVGPHPPAMRLTKKNDKETKWTKAGGTVEGSHYCNYFEGVGSSHLTYQMKEEEEEAEATIK